MAGGDAAHGDVAHWDVAAYALGVLDDTDSVLFEAHLALCPRCSRELESLLPVASLLSDVDAGTLRDAAAGDRADRLFEAVGDERRRARSRRLLTAVAAAAAATVIAGSSLFAGARWLGDTDVVAGPDEPPAVTGPATTPTPGSGIGGPDLGNGELFSFTDPQSGARADVVLEQKDWGTQLSFALWSVSGPLACQLLVVDSAGSTEVVSSWRVPPDGYGTPEHPAPLLLQSATAVSRAELSHIEVQAVDPGGTTTTLVAVEF